MDAQPYSYASLCGLLVQINILIMSTWKGVEWALWLHSFGSRLTAQPKFWVDIFALFAWNVSCMHHAMDRPTSAHPPREHEPEPE